MKYKLNATTGNLDLIGNFATKTTRLAVTGFNATGTIYDVTASGAGPPYYTKSGDDGALLGSAAKFNGDEKIMVFLNGVYQIKGEDVEWVTATTFIINQDIDTGDKITIIS